MSPIILFAAAMLAVPVHASSSASTGRPAIVTVAANSAVDRWYGGEYQDCTGTTLDIVECVLALRDRWDTRLNAAYGTVKDTFSSERQKALRDVQRRWLAYRDANCAFYAAGDGSISRIEAATCLMVMTRERAQELQMMMEQ